MICSCPAGDGRIKEARTRVLGTEPSCWAPCRARVMFFMVDFFEALEKRACIASATDGLRASSQVAGHHASGDPSRCDGASKRSMKGPLGPKDTRGIQNKE